MAYASELARDLMGPSPDRFTIYTPAQRLREKIFGKNTPGRLELGDLAEMAMDPFLLTGLLGGTVAKVGSGAAGKLLNRRLGYGARSVPYAAKELADPALNPQALGRVWEESPLSPQDLAQAARQAAEGGSRGGVSGASLEAALESGDQPWFDYRVPEGMIHRGVKPSNEFGSFQFGPGAVVSTTPPAGPTVPGMTDVTKSPEKATSMLAGALEKFGLIDSHPGMFGQGRQQAARRGGYVEYLSTANREKLLDLRGPGGMEQLREISRVAEQRALNELQTNMQTVGSTIRGGRLVTQQEAVPSAKHALNTLRGSRQNTPVFGKLALELANDKALPDEALTSKLERFTTRPVADELEEQKSLLARAISDGRDTAKIQERINKLQVKLEKNQEGPAIDELYAILQQRLPDSELTAPYTKIERGAGVARQHKILNDPAMSLATRNAAQAKEP